MGRRGAWPLAGCLGKVPLSPQRGGTGPGWRWWRWLALGAPRGLTGWVMLLVCMSLARFWVILVLLPCEAHCWASLGVGAMRSEVGPARGQEA